ncbi:MAG TPA: glycosyl transferase [Chitinophagaceae bacterium]|nr:glycosyl transferase [Chitinophagaceae bacterium]
MPKVSVIIPCYNQGLFIEEAIDSVLVQSYQDFEIIVINDGSDDVVTIDILNGLKKSHTTIYHITNAGVSAARNYGIIHSSGTFILPLDADDRIDSRLLEMSVSLLEQNPQLELIATGVKFFGEINTKELLPAYNPKQHLLQNLFFNTSLFRKASFDKLNGYDESFKEGWEDWDFFLRLVDDVAQVYVIQDYLLHYRIKSSSRNADLLEEKKQRVEQQLFLKHIEKFQKYFPEPIQIFRDHQFLLEQSANFEKYKNELLNSKSYLLGNFLLNPFKWISKLKGGSK